MYLLAKLSFCCTNCAPFSFWLYTHKQPFPSKKEMIQCSCIVAASLLGDPCHLIYCSHTLLHTYILPHPHAVSSSRAMAELLQSLPKAHHQSTTCHAPHWTRPSLRPTSVTTPSLATTTTSCAEADHMTMTLAIPPLLSVA